MRVRGEDVHLTPTEFDLLVCLANTPRAVLSREQLLAEVWDWADASGTRTVDSHIKALRRKIGAERIRTVHGVGYALETPAAMTAAGPDAARTSEREAHRVAAGPGRACARWTRTARSRPRSARWSSSR